MPEYCMEKTQSLAEKLNIHIVIHRLNKFGLLDYFLYIVYK
jgi:hypothetical protein